MSTTPADSSSVAAPTSNKGNSTVWPPASTPRTKRIWTCVFILAHTPSFAFIVKLLGDGNEEDSVQKFAMLDLLAHVMFFAVWFYVCFGILDKAVYFSLLNLHLIRVLLMGDTVEATVLGQSETPPTEKETPLHILQAREIRKTRSRGKRDKEAGENTVDLENTTDLSYHYRGVHYQARLFQSGHLTQGDNVPVRVLPSQPDRAILKRTSCQTCCAMACISLPSIFGGYYFSFILFNDGLCPSDEAEYCGLAKWTFVFVFLALYVVPRMRYLYQNNLVTDVAVHGFQVKLPALEAIEAVPVTEIAMMELGDAETQERAPLVSDTIIGSL